MADFKRTETKSNVEVAAEAEGWIAAGPYCILDGAGEKVAAFAGVDKAANRAFVLVACRSHEALVGAANLGLAALNEAQGEWQAVSKTYAPEWTHPLKQASDALSEAIAKATSPEGAAVGEVACG